MSKKKANPYREGTAYNRVFEDLRAAGNKGISRSELEALGHSKADINVVLSPRSEDEVRTVNGQKADCRGNFSAQGHKYFVSKRIPKGEKAKDACFSLRWRKEELSRHVRPVSKKVESKKTQVASESAVTA